MELELDVGQDARAVVDLLDGVRDGAGDGAALTVVQLARRRSQVSQVDDSTEGWTLPCIITDRRFAHHLPIRFEGLLVAGVIPEHWRGYVSRRWRGVPRFGQLRLGYRQCEQGHCDPRDCPTRHFAWRGLHLSL